MPDSHWEKLNDIFHAVLALSPRERAAYLDNACGGNDLLRRSVESLLASHEQDDSFVDRPAFQAAAELLLVGFEPKPGQFVGHYRIVSLLGEGGMGRVYLAEDTKLHRKVSLKFVSTNSVQDEGRLRRFEQEACAASVLNHPNILTIHEIVEADGLRAIVAEFIDGQTLRDKLNKGPITVAEALHIAEQIASALAAAHAESIIHRDIKPENIMLRRDGVVKVLDFGVAKMSEAAYVGQASGPNIETPPPWSPTSTEPGSVMGTVTYMSPEQACGLAVDARTDIWSLGAIIYEMLAGPSAFTGNSRADVIESILHREPTPLSLGSHQTSERLERVINKALQKDRELRYQTANELLADIRDLKQRLQFELELRRTQPAAAIPTEDTGFFKDTAGLRTHQLRRLLRSKGAWLILFISLAISIFFTGLAPRLIWKFAATGPGDVLTVERMRQTRLTQNGDVFSPTISPDGQYLVYVSSSVDDRRRGLRLLQIATGRILELLSPRPNVQFWGTTFSRDSNYVYYTENIEGTLGTIYRIPSLGGAPQIIIEDGVGLSISPDGKRLVFKRVDNQGSVTSLIVADSDGSNQRTITTTDTDSNYQSLDWSPDGSTIAYVFKQHEPKKNSWYVAEVPATGGAERRIGEPRNSRIISALWLPDGRGFVMNALDPRTNQMQLFYLSYPDGAERRITSDLNGYWGISITADGKSILTQRMELNRELWTLSDSDNKLQAQQLTFKREQHFEAVTWLSDNALLFDVDENANFGRHNIWRWKIGDTEPQPLTIGAGNNYFPVVSPNGRTIVFISNRSGRPQLWRMNTDGTQPTQITNLDFDIFEPQLAADGETALFKTWFGGKGRLMRVSVNGGEAISLTDETDVYLWALSPDGKKLAYSTLDSATQRVVTRIRLVERDETEQVLNIEPFNWLQWSDDGQALYFALADDGAKNIWRQSLSEKKPHPITNFNDRKQIFRFFRSPDGNKLACIRFDENYDALLLNFDK